MESETDGNSLEAEWPAIFRKVKRSNQCLHCYWIFLDRRLRFCPAMDIGHKGIVYLSKTCFLNMLIPIHCQKIFWESDITLNRGTTAPGSFWADLWTNCDRNRVRLCSPVKEWSELLVLPAFLVPYQHYLSSWPWLCSKSVLLPAYAQGNWTGYRHDSILEVAFQHFTTPNCLCS